VRDAEFAINTDAGVTVITRDQLAVHACYPGVAVVPYLESGGTEPVREAAHRIARLAAAGNIGARGQEDVQ
jgi:hypothetical protein